MLNAWLFAAGIFLLQVTHVDEPTNLWCTGRLYWAT